jgi:5'-nucleotidase
MLRHMRPRLKAVSESGEAERSDEPARSACVRALITNDDGIESPGLHELAGAVRGAGWDVVIAAPSREFSGSSAALTAVEDDGRIVVEPKTLDGLDGVPTFAVAASPAFIVHLASAGGFGAAPDAVLSGVNLGANTGRSVLHSGTVGAALTAALDGVPALAASLDVGLEPPDERWWGTAAAVVRKILPILTDLPEGVALNVNVPNLSYPELRGVRRCTLARFGAVQMTIAERGSGFVRMELQDSEFELEPDSDDAALAQGYVSVTPLQPIGDADVVLPYSAVPTAEATGAGGYPDSRHDN